MAVPGGAARSYFHPDPKYYYAAADLGTGATITQKHVAAVESHVYLPDLYDAYGQPILGWQEDERAQGAPGASFAREKSDDGIARFYWASNACFLTSTGLGRMMQSQNANSLLGRAAGPNPWDSMMGLLGNPAFPEFGSIPRARGPIVFQSAGANGLFLGLGERGAIIARGTSATPAPMGYFPGVDPMKNGDFDDIVIGAGQ
jgi:hypothetical protein